MAALSRCGRGNAREKTRFRKGGMLLRNSARQGDAREKFRLPGGPSSWEPTSTTTERFGHKRSTLVRRRLGGVARTTDPGAAVHGHQTISTAVPIDSRDASRFLVPSEDRTSDPDPRSTANKTIPTAVPIDSQTPTVSVCIIGLHVRAPMLLSRRHKRVVRCPDRSRDVDRFGGRHATAPCCSRGQAIAHAEIATHANQRPRRSGAVL